MDVFGAPLFGMDAFGASPITLGTSNAPPGAFDVYPPALLVLLIAPLAAPVADDFAPDAAPFATSVVPLAVEGTDADLGTLAGADVWEDGQ